MIVCPWPFHLGCHGTGWSLLQMRIYSRDSLSEEKKVRFFRTSSSSFYLEVREDFPRQQQSWLITDLFQEKAQ